MQGKKTNEEIIKRPRLFYEKWLKHFAAWQASGESEAKYCARYNLSLKAFKKHYWRSRKEKALTENSGGSVVSRPQPAGNFAPVKLVGVSTTATIEFIFRSGVVMKVPSSASLVAVLKSLEIYL